MGRPSKPDTERGETLSIRMNAHDRTTLDALVAAMNTEAGALGASATRTSVILWLVRREAQARVAASPKAAAKVSPPPPSPKPAAKPTKPAKVATAKASPKGKR